MRVHGVQNHQIKRKIDEYLHHCKKVAHFDRGQLHLGTKLIQFEKGFAWSIAHIQFIVEFFGINWSIINTAKNKSKKVGFCCYHNFAL